MLLFKVYLFVECIYSLQTKSRVTCCYVAKFWALNDFVGLGSRMSCNQPALKFIRLSLAIRMRNVPYVGKKAGGETRSEQPPFTYTFPRFFTLSILMFFTHLFTSFYHDFPVLFLDVLTQSTGRQGCNAITFCGHVFHRHCLDRSGGSRGRWTPRLHCLHCLQRIGAGFQLPVGHLGSAEIAPCSVMKSPPLDGLLQS